MSTRISPALSASGIVEYHTKANRREQYYSKEACGEWFGKQCEALGLTVGGAVDAEHFARLADGQDPLTGEQLIAWKRPAENAPAWVRQDEAWAERVDRLMADSIGVTDVFRAVDNGPLERSRGAERVVPVTVRTERETKLLEMHAIARQVFIDNLTTGTMDYLRGRGIRPKTAEEFGIGVSDGSGYQLLDRLRHYGPDLLRASGLFVERPDGTMYDRFRDRLMFPVENERGETVAFGGRRSPEDKHSAKYINSPETEIYRKSSTLYNLHRAAAGMERTGEAMVVEGYMDALAAYQAGQRNVVASCGTSFTAEQAASIREQATTLVINLDGNAAGKNATEKAVRTALSAGLEPRVLSLAPDPADWIKSHKAEEYRDAVREPTPLIQYLAQRAPEKHDIQDFYGRIDAMKWMEQSLQAVPSSMRERVSRELEQHLGVKSDQKTPMEHRAGWDITFSAPKGYSLTALVGGDYRLVHIHDEAVKEALTYGERAIQVKMGGIHAPETTSKLVAALFRHDTARPVDGYAAPQLHTHAVVFNMSQDQEGKVRALNPTELFRLQSAMEAVYQSHMAFRARELGYETVHGANHSSDIKGYTQEYLDAESKRGEEIEAEMDRIGQHGPRAGSLIALKTRSAKLDLPAEEIIAAHQSHAQQYGDQPSQVVAAARERQNRILTPEEREHAADRAVEYARSRLSERTTVMEWYEIDRDALRLAQGNIRLDDVAEAFGRAEWQGKFQETSHWRDYAPEHRYTTPELRGKEQKILAWMAEGQGQVNPIAGTITKDEFREKFREHLNDGQKHLVWDLIHSRDRMVGVQGLAGTGKTSALGVLRGFAEDYGFEVRGVAATGGASNQLTKAGIEANTLAGFIQHSAAGTSPRLYLLDEASLADIHQMSDFLDRVRSEDRVVVIGDVKQHGSVGAGRIFQELQDAGMRTLKLRTIVRQQTEEYRAVVRQFSRGEIKEALGSLDEQGRIHEASHEVERYREFAEMFVQDTANTLGVAPDNRACAGLTEQIREQRTAAGQLGDVRYQARVLMPRSEMQREDLVYAVNYNPGDVLVFAQKNSMGLRKGDRAAVMQIDPDKNLLTVMREQDGRMFTYNPGRVGTSVGVYEPAAREFAQGDRIQFTKNMPQYGVMNRQLGTIVALAPDGTAQIELDGTRDAAGNLRMWNGNLDKCPHLDHGYVMTSFSAQGATAERVLIHLDTDAPSTSRMLTQQLIYVAASRGKFDMHVYTNDLEDLAEALCRLEQAPMALSPEQIKACRDAVEKARQRGQGMAV